MAARTTPLLHTIAELEARFQAQRHAAQVARGEVCPDCESTQTEGNGHGEYCCMCCDHRWGVDMGERYGY